MWTESQRPRRNKAPPLNFPHTWQCIQDKFALTMQRIIATLPSRTSHEWIIVMRWDLGSHLMGPAPHSCQFLLYEEWQVCRSAILLSARNAAFTHCLHSFTALYMTNPESFRATETKLWREQDVRTRPLHLTVKSLLADFRVSGFVRILMRDF